MVGRSSLLLLFVLVAGCNALAMGGADRASLHAGTLVEGCPLGVPWTRIEMKAAGDDVVLDFSTSHAANVAELRQRVRDQAEAYGPNKHLGKGHDGEHRGPRDHGLRLWTMAPAETSVVDTSAGARLQVAAIDSARRAELREQLAERVGELNRADCPH